MPTPSVKAMPVPAAKTRITTESIEDFVSVLETEIESSRAAVSRDDSISFVQITFPKSIAQHNVLDALDKYEDPLLKFDIDWVQSYVELQVCMPSMVHERTAQSVTGRVISELTLRGDKKGLGVDFDSLGITLTGRSRIDGAEKSKEADISFTPKSQIIPTVVVEVGYREPETDLRDAEDWLHMKDDTGVYKVNLVILLRVFPDSDRFKGQLWKRDDDSGQPTCIWKQDIRPTDLDTTTPIHMEIQLADLYDNEIPPFLEGTGPIILDLRKMASDASKAKVKMAMDPRNSFQYYI